MHKTTQLIAVLCALAGALTARAQSFNPVPLTPSSFTHDIIVEASTPPPGGSPANYGLTATVGGGTGFGDNTFFETGLRRGYFGGMPTNGATFTHLSKPAIQYTMAPDYKDYHSVLIDSSVTSGSLTFASPTAVTNLSILGTGGGGAVTVNYTVTHADASTESGSISFVDWFGGANYAWTNSGRITAGGTYNNINDTGGNPRLYSSEITVSGASPVVSIDFTHSSGARANIFAISGNATGTWTPMTLTGFAQKVVVPAAFPVTATMDQGTNTAFNVNLATWFEKGFATASGFPDSGLPHPGALLTNVNQPTHIFQMASSYAAKNAILIDTNNQTANITPLNPTNYSAFALLTAGGNIGGANIMTNIIIMQHLNGVNETNLFFGYDWFATNAQIAYVTGGRVNMAARTVNSLANPITLANNPKLFESTFGLEDTTSPVTNIVLKFGSSPNVNSTTFVLAVSATAGAVVPVIASQTAFQNIFLGSNATFTAQISAGSPPLTYLWHFNDSPLANGGKISGATTNTMTLTGADFSDSGFYTLIVTNVAGAVTSAPIRLTVMSTNPDVTLPGDVITAYQPNGGSTPANENVDRSLDNTTTKYLNFGANNGAPFFGPVGFNVTPLQGASIVTALRFYAANDAVGRDPMDYQLEGSTNGVDFEFITSGAMDIPATRNPADLPINPLTQSLTEVQFANTASYSSYRVSFNNVREPSTASSMQIGEVELLGTLSTSPPAILVDLHPTNVLAFVGLTTTLSLSASGTPPLIYRWTLNGSEISGATNATYAFPALAGTNFYACTVSNATGSTASSGTATVVGMPLTLNTTFAVNFHNGQNRAAGADFGYAGITYVGQGAYTNTGNNIWNAWQNNNGFPAPTITSAGFQTPISLTLTNVGFNNGGLEFSPHPDGAGGNTLQGLPGFLLGYNAAVNGGNRGGIILNDVPDGSYDLYLYGANYDNDRGANFTFNGVTKTAANNPAINGANPGTNFVEGLNYVVFQGLTPSNGIISGTWDGIFTNPNTSQSGEGTFNGLQLVKVPTPSVTLMITPSGGSQIVSWSPAIGQLQQAGQLTGVFTNVTGATTPYTNTPSGAESYFRVKVQ